MERIAQECQGYSRAAQTDVRFGLPVIVRSAGNHQAQASCKLEICADFEGRMVGMDNFESVQTDVHELANLQRQLGGVPVFHMHRMGEDRQTDRKSVV